jgi:hypothetical protein
VSAALASRDQGEKGDRAIDRVRGRVRTGREITLRTDLST